MFLDYVLSWTTKHKNAFYVGKKYLKDLLNRILLQQKHNVLKAFSKQGKNKLLFLHNIGKTRFKSFNQGKK